MKYGHEYSEALANNDFPTAWVSAAVSYRALKKSIKQIQLELEGYGLDPETLKSLDSSFGVRQAPDGQDGHLQPAAFRPELWVAVDGDTGHFIHAGLTASTKEYLHRSRSTLSLGKTIQDLTPAVSLAGTEAPPITDIPAPIAPRAIWKQIPLRTVTDFFASLDPALAGLETVQDNESRRLKDEILELGNGISTATTSSATSKSRAVKASQKDMRLWRQIFELYVETPIFFSNHEVDHGSRSHIRAKAQLQLFSDRLVKTGLAKKFQTPASKSAFAKFIALNLDILKVMHFEEINTTAIRKILKKFDKRTNLGASRTYGTGSAGINGVLARSIAKNMCAEIQSNVLVVVPSLDDYMCPICSEIAWKPIKLGCCSAVFCIRCVIHLQRGDDGRCPMCRAETIPSADASRIDGETMERMKKYFPKEVKIKQIANERASGIDLYGPDFYKNTCALM